MRIREGKTVIDNIVLKRIEDIKVKSRIEQCLKSITNDLRLKNKIVITVWAIVRTFLLVGLGFIILYPLLNMIPNSFMSSEDVLDPSVVWVPKSLTLEHLKLAWFGLDYPRALWKTIQLSVGSALCQLVCCSIVGYGFARFRFKGREFLFGLVIFTIIVPPPTIFIPLYVQYRFFDFFGISRLIAMITGNNYTNYTINLLNTDATFFLPSILGVGFRSGLFVYVFRQFFRGIPKELEEAAKIDGCGAFKTFLKIMVPNAIPAFITVFLFSVVWHWNESILCNSFYKTGNVPLAVALQLMFSRIQHSMEVGATTDLPIELRKTIGNAGTLLFILPLIILYIFTQRYFIEGVETTGIKE